MYSTSYARDADPTQTLGSVIFLLMIRWSMVIGWYELLKDPRQLLHRFQRRRPSVGSQDFIMQGSSPKHISLGRPLDSEKTEPPKSPNQATREELQGLNSAVTKDAHANKQVDKATVEHGGHSVRASETDGEEEAAEKPLEEDEVMV
jgi:hypothetical protein